MSTTTLQTVRARAESLVLRRIVKENHGHGVNQLCRCPASSVGGLDCTHVVATVGSNQCNVYDNHNCGSHLDMMCQYVNEDLGLAPPSTTAAAGQEKAQPASNVDSDIRCCAWLQTEDDIAVVLGTSCGEIQVLSIAQTRVVCVLKGHAEGTPIVDLAVTYVTVGEQGGGESGVEAHRRPLILSSSLDGSVRLASFVFALALFWWEGGSTPPCCAARSPLTSRHLRPPLNISHR